MEPRDNLPFQHYVACAPGKGGINVIIPSGYVRVNHTAFLKAFGMATTVLLGLVRVALAGLLVRPYISLQTTHTATYAYV
jgi:hypothetical protein